MGVGAQGRQRFEPLVGGTPSVELGLLLLGGDPDGMLRLGIRNGDEMPRLEVRPVGRRAGRENARLHDFAWNRPVREIANGAARPDVVVERLRSRAHDVRVEIGTVRQRDGAGSGRQEDSGTEGRTVRISVPRAPVKRAA